MISINDIISRCENFIPLHMQKIFLDKVFQNSNDLKIRKKIISEVKKYIDENKISYIFVSAKTFFNQSILSNKLSQNGNKNISISLSNQENSSRDSDFDHVYRLTILEFINLIQTTKIVIFSQGWLFRYNLNVLIEIFKGSNKHYVDVMDLNNFLFPSINKTNEKILKTCWGDDVLKNNEMQKWCEYFLFTKSDKIYFPGSIKHVQTLKLDRKLISKKYFINHPIQKRYFHHSTSTNDIVFAGGIPPFQKRRPNKLFGDAQLISTLKLFFKDNFPYKFDVYNNPYIVNFNDYKKFYKPHYELMANYPNYRFLFGYEGNQIRKVLSTYKIGAMFYDFKDNIIGKNHFKNMIPTKFYLYLEAGLPIILSEEWEEAAKIIQNHNLGTVIKQNEIKNLKNILDNLDFDNLKSNVLNYREILYQDSMVFL